MHMLRGNSYSRDVAILLARYYSFLPTFIAAIFSAFDLQLHGHQSVFQLFFVGSYNQS